MSFTLLDLPNELLINIAKRLDGYSKISLFQSCQRLNDVSNCNELVKYVDVSCQYKVTDGDLKQFLEQHPRCMKIETLNIEGCYWLSRDILMKVVEKLDNLKRLYTIHTQLTLADINKLAAKLKHLTDVSLLLHPTDEQDPLAMKYNFQNLKMLFIKSANCRRTIKTRCHISQLNFKAWKRNLKTLSSFLGLDRDNTSFEQEMCVYRKFWNPKLDLSKSFVNYLNQLFERKDEQPSMDIAMKAMEKFLPGYPLNSEQLLDPVCFFEHDIAHKFGFQEIDSTTINSLKLINIDYTNCSGKIGHAFQYITKLIVETSFFMYMAHDKDVPKGLAKRYHTGELANSQQPIKNIAQICLNLEELEIFQVERNTLTDVSEALFNETLLSISHLRYLKTLTLSRLEINDSSLLKSIAKGCTALRTLFIHKIKFYYDYIADLQQCINSHTNLEQFYFVDYKGKTINIFKALANCKNLQCVVIKTLPSTEMFDSIGLCEFINQSDELVYFEYIDHSMSGKQFTHLVSHLKKCKPNLHFNITWRSSITCNCIKCAGNFHNKYDYLLDI